MHEGQIMKRSWLLTIVINGQGIMNETRRVAAKFHLCFFFLLTPDFFLPPHNLTSTMASWVFKFRSPSPCTDDESCLPVRVGAGANTDLIHDLDLSLREDKALYNPNPFTLAKRKSMRGGGRKISNGKSFCQAQI